MRILAPLLLVLLGAMTSLIVARLCGVQGRSRIAQAVIGISGAFAGIWIRDALDILVVGPLVDTLSAALLGAATLALVFALSARR